MPIASLIADLNPWHRDPRARLALAYPVRRDLQPKLLEHVGRPGERRYAAIVGPRQVGKSTILWQTIDDVLDAGARPNSIVYFDFGDDRVPRDTALREVVETAVANDPGDDGAALFLFDEVTRSRGWDAHLRTAVDRGPKGYRFIVTDSAASLLRAESGESAVGRWDEFRLEGLSFAEFVQISVSGRAQGDARSLLDLVPSATERFLELGGFPEHAGSEPGTSVRRRLREDVGRRAISHDLARPGVDVERVKRLLVHLLVQSGLILDVEKVRRALKDTVDGRDHMPHRNSVGQWLAILEQAALMVRLEPWAIGSAQLSKKPRAYAADHGLISAFWPGPHPMTDPRARGRIFEAAVFRQLRQWCREHDAGVGYYRSGDRWEIDFIVDTGKERLGVEVTASRRPDDGSRQALRRAGDRLKSLDRLILVIGGAVRSADSDVQTVSMQDFLLDTDALLRNEM